MADKRDNRGLLSERKRRALIKPDKRDEIAQRVLDMARKDESARTLDLEMRLQRYAKFRMWTQDGGDWPWSGSSDVGITDMMTDALSLQDTMENAILANRPFATSRALKEHDQAKQPVIDDLLDTQLFIEQPGEEAISESSSAFGLDGVFTAYIPYIREGRKVSIFRTFPGFENGEIPKLRFEKLIAQEFPNTEQIQTDDEGWDWEITDEEDQTFAVKFYTASDGEIEMTGRRMVEVFDGPKVIIKDYEDVLTPPRTANLRIPGPSNPGGASHVILVDHPTVDEIQRLVDDGTYDLIDAKTMKEIVAASPSAHHDHDEEKQQKDVIQGEADSSKPDDDTHGTLTRYTCFDLFDLDDDGINIDVIWWVLREPALLLKAKSLTEMYPMVPPRRPLAEATMIPVKGRREGIGLLEMMEPMHDLKKELFDQVVDAGTLGIMPPWFYRATSNMKPEVLRFGPGEGFPLSDPQRDINVVDFSNNSAQTMALNLMAVADAAQEKLTVRGDLQLGRVPVGRSSALRTTQNLQSLLSEGEARPQRILRRFLLGWIEIFKQMHELNQHFLPEKKQFRIVGIRDPKDDPYREVSSSEDIQGRFQFDFAANILNINLSAQQEGLEKLMSVYVGELPLQLGISNPNTIYRLLRDWGKAVQGRSADQYIDPPSPDALHAPIQAVDAITQIMNGQLPEGLPMEGAQAHMAVLELFRDTENLFGLLDSPDKVALFRTYMGKISQRLRLESQAKAAGQGAGGQQGQPGAPPGGGPQPNLGPPPVQPNELTDETLPGAGGGGAQ